MKGKFITFEGGEGCGKTTQVELLENYLVGKNYEVVRTREPGGSIIGPKIREILLSPDSKLDVRAETLLFLADRAQHVEEKIKPALEEGKIVISDRYIDSTYVYQCFARGEDRSLLKIMQQYATDGLKPDLTFVLDITAEEGLNITRTEEFGKKDRFESEELYFHKKINEAYRTIAKEEPERIKLIPRMGKQETYNEIKKHIDELLKL